MTELTVVVADDEPPARRKLARLIDAEPGLKLVAEAANGAEAVTAVRAHRPDVLFLDVQMPEPDGFGVLEALAGERLPHIVFVTAFDEYAVKAFEVQAVDYLLKPYDPPRFRNAVERVRERASAGRASSERINELLAGMLERRTPVERLLVDAGERSYFVPANEIDWIEAAGNYAVLHAGGERHIVRATLTSLEKSLDPQRFARVHKGHIVNLDRVRELRPWSHGDRVVVLTDGTELMLSRRYRDRLERFFPG